MGRVDGRFVICKRTLGPAPRKGRSGPLPLRSLCQDPEARLRDGAQGFHVLDPLGDDPLAALAHAGELEDFSCASTAGGAFLAWLEGETLPGVQALEDAA